MTDLQKAQCFFMMAVNIAALVDQYQGDLETQTLQQLYNSRLLIKSISISGYLPVTVTLLGLHMVEMISWYLLIISILTVGISMATLFGAGSFSPHPSDLSAFAPGDQQKNSACGGNNLTVYCLQTQDDTGDFDPGTGAYVILGLCVVVLVFLVADQSHAFLKPSTKEPRPWLLKAYKKCVLDSFSLRGFEFILALTSIFSKSKRYLRPSKTISYLHDLAPWLAPWSAPWPIIDTFPPDFWFFYVIAYFFYIFAISHLGHGRIQKVLGKLKNDWFLFAADLVTAVLWLLYSLPGVNIVGIAAWYGDLPNRLIQAALMVF